MNALSTVPKRAAAVAAVLTVLAACCPVLAADTAPLAAPAASPRIGLALSGGGARGIAHVGVLKALEEMRVPIHCVTGTSMGAIVGATFAAGRTPAEMEKLVLAADWQAIFRDQPPRKEIAVRRKIDDYKTLFAPEFGVKDGSLALPKGVIAGVSIESFFRMLATPAFGITDFQKLPIPFRAMATDIETGESVVLDRGSIAQAMRASMSVPGAIAPGTAMLARIACATLPRSSTTDSPVSMSVAIARNGIGSLLKSLMPDAGSATTRKNASIETPAMMPFGSARPPSFTPYSPANRVL